MIVGIIDSYHTVFASCPDVSVAVLKDGTNIVSRKVKCLTVVTFHREGVLAERGFLQPIPVGAKPQVTLAVTVEGGELVGIAPAILQVGIVEWHEFVLVAVVPCQSAPGGMYPKLAIDVFDYHLVFTRIDNLVAIDIVKDKVTG